MRGGPVAHKHTIWNLDFWSTTMKSVFIPPIHLYIKDPDQQRKPPFLKFPSKDLATPFLVNDILEPPQNSQYPTSRCENLILKHQKQLTMCETFSNVVLGCNAQLRLHLRRPPSSTPLIEPHPQVSSIPVFWWKSLREKNVLFDL